jgi:Ser/Thr protein kinase RdoA (MazF antagonist)
MKEVYDITRDLAGKNRAVEKPVKSKNGDTLTDIEEKMG